MINMVDKTSDVPDAFFNPASNVVICSFLIRRSDLSDVRHASTYPQPNALRGDTQATFSEAVLQLWKPTGKPTGGNLRVGTYGPKGNGSVLLLVAHVSPQKRLQFRCLLSAVARAMQDTEISAPRADRVTILVSHDAG